VKATLLQRAVVMVCCEDTGVLPAQEDAALPAACGGSGCSPSGAPPQTDPGGILDLQHLHNWVEGGIQGTPV